MARNFLLVESITKCKLSFGYHFTDMINVVGLYVRIKCVSTHTAQQEDSLTKLFSQIVKDTSLAFVKTCSSPKLLG